MQSEVAVTRLSSCECCIECIRRILEYAPMVLAYRGTARALVRCVRHVYGDLHREDLPVQPFPRCRRCFFCRHAVMFELSSPEWPVVLGGPCAAVLRSVWLCQSPYTLRALRAGSIQSIPLVIPRHPRHFRHSRHPSLSLPSTPPEHPRIFCFTSE